MGRNNGEKSYKLEDDLGTMNSKAFSNACFGYGPINGYYQYYIVITYKKGNNYFVYLNDKIEIKNFIENNTYVTN